MTKCMKVTITQTLVLPDNGELRKGHWRELQAIRKGDDLHSTRTLGGVVLQTLGHLFLLYKCRSIIVGKLVEPFMPRVHTEIYRNNYPQIRQQQL